MPAQGKLKILFINSIQMFGGGEIWMLTAIQELLNRGHEIGLICRPGTELAERASCLDISVFTIPMRGDLDPVTIFRFYRIMSSFSTDVVLTNMDKELRLAGMATRFYRIPVLIPRRGIDYPLKNKLLYKLAYRNWADGIIANSQSTKRSLLKNAPWLPAEKVKVIYNGIDPQKFEIKSVKLRKRFRITEDDFVFGFVGQLDERKGLNDLLPAFENVCARQNRSRLLIAGEGRMRGDIERFIREKDLQNSVHLLGFIDNVPEFMANIDALVLPSLWEGFGIVLIEAMAAGKAVIATNTSNIPEIVSDGDVGRLVPPGDHRTLAAAMSEFIDDPTVAEKMGERGKKLVREKFTLIRMADDLEAYFYWLRSQKKMSAE